MSTKNPYTGENLSETLDKYDIVMRIFFHSIAVFLEF
jgi:hypothetical protein